jgi:hypothetical protein
MENLKDVCLTCLTNEEDPENGYCINGHKNCTSSNMGRDNDQT